MLRTDAIAPWAERYENAVSAREYAATPARRNAIRPFCCPVARRMARIRTVPTTMSDSGYARLSALAAQGPPASQTVRSPKPHAVEVRARATMTPSNQTRHREDVPKAASLQKARMPATANGTANRNPASASDGDGTGIRSPTSYIDQTTSPPAQRPLEMAINAQPRRSLPEARLADQTKPAKSSAHVTPA